MKNAAAIVYGDNALSAVALAATPTGTGNDCVAVWAGTDFNRGQGAITEWATRSALASEPADGTSWTIIRRGLYLVTVSILVTPSVTVHGGINFAGVAAELLRNPDRVDTRTRDVAIAVTPAATNVTLKLAALIGVTQLVADAGTGILRVLLSNGANAGPAGAALTLAQCAIDIRRADDLN